MPWELPSPWNWITTLGTLAVLWVAIFWVSLHAYHRRYFAGKALQLACLRSLGWILLYGGSFALISWLATWTTPAGWVRYLVIGSAWWLLSETILALAWYWFDRLLEVL